VVLFIAAAALLAGCGAQSDGDAVPLGAGTFGGTVVADGQLAAGFSKPLEENARRGEKPRRSLGTLCMFLLHSGQLGGGGCGGFASGSYIGDRGCGNSYVFGVGPNGGRALVTYLDGRRQSARFYAAPARLQIRLSIFYASRRGIHTVKSVAMFSASGRLLRTEPGDPGPNDVSITCHG
jgi:hypothetical protein